MPISHDQKPRNRGRRAKARNPEPRSSLRSELRRRLRRYTLVAQAFEKDVREVLAFEGKSWQYFERASRAESQRIITLAEARMKSDTLRKVA